MSEYVKAEWGIPHCDFATTASGFRVEYRQSSFGAFAGLKAFGQFTDSLSSKGNIGALLLIVVFLLVPLALFGALVSALGTVLGTAVAAGLVGFLGTWIVSRFFVKTTIEVTRDAVIIDDKKYERAAFGGFAVALKHQPHAPQQAGHLDTGDLATLSFTYGNRTLPLPGVWPSRQAEEFASSLNQRLRTTPQMGDEHRPSANNLRSAAQSSDF